MKELRIWVIEIYFDETGRWEPTVAVGLTREDARKELADWRKQSPYDKGRVRPYRRDVTKGRP